MTQKFDFKKSLTYKIIRERWAGRDMEKYFEEKGKAHYEKLKRELKRDK